MLIKHCHKIIILYTIRYGMARSENKPAFGHTVPDCISYILPDFFRSPHNQLFDTGAAPVSPSFLKFI